MTRALLLCAVIVCGCEERTWWFANLPESARSMIVAVHHEADLYVAAVDLDSADQPLYLQVADEAEPNVQIEILLYDRALENLDIIEGVLELNSTTHSRPLPSTKSIYRSTVSNGVVAKWEPLDSMSEKLDSFRIAEGRYCPVMVEVIEVEYPDPPRAAIRFLLPIGPDLVVGGRSDGSAFLVSPTEVKPIDVSPPITAFNTGVLGSDHRLWVVTDTMLARAELSADRQTLNLMTETSSPTAFQDFQGWLDVGSSTTGVEAFLLQSVDGRIMRYGDGEVKVIELAMINGGSYGGIVRVGEQEAIAVHGDLSKAYHYHHGVSTSEELDVDITDIFMTAIRVPGFGPLVGTEFGKVFEYDPVSRHWSNIIDMRVRYTVRHITPYQSSFVVLGLQSWLLFYFPNRDPCFASEEWFGYDNRYIVGFTERLVAASEHGDVFYWYQPIYSE